MSILRLSRRPPQTVPVNATAMDAIEIMVEKGLGAVAVTEGTALRGIFTERDVVKKIVLGGVDPKETPIAEVMTDQPKTVGCDTDISDALTIMSVNRIRHLPVLNESGGIEGMLSLRFLMHEQLENTLGELRSLESYMSADGPGG